MFAYKKKKKKKKHYKKEGKNLLLGFLRCFLSLYAFLSSVYVISVV